MIHALALALILTASAQVTLRGGEATPAGDVVAIDAGGIWLGPAPTTTGDAPKPAPAPPPAPGSRPAPTTAAPAGAVLGISWDRVKSCDNPQAAQYLSSAEQAWRARARLERADFIAAEPIFETLYQDSFRSQSGPTAAVVSEGLLRCRLHRGAHVKAVGPWLTLLHTSGPQPAPILHANWAAEAGLTPVLDPNTGLAPGLPPIWLALPALNEIARSDAVLGPGLRPGEKPTALDQKVQTLADIYIQAARYEAGQPASLADLTTNDPGVAIAWQIVQSRIGDASQRDTARRFLADRIKPPTNPSASPPPAWLEAWCHAAIGRSLLREDAPEQKRLGIVELLNLPARYQRVHPYLSGLALAEASAALRALGDKTGSDILATELFRQYPSHPALDWGPMRSFIPRAEPMPKPAAPPQDPPPSHQ